MPPRRSRRRRRRPRRYRYSNAKLAQLQADHRGTSLHRSIERFLRTNKYHRRPLEDLLVRLLETCRYANGDTLYRHRWCASSEEAASDSNDGASDNGASDNTTNNEATATEATASVELLWGDPQLGKRLHACCVMWMLTRVVGMPVLYVFRNLHIDMEQLKLDISGTKSSDFNVQFVQAAFRPYVRVDKESDDASSQSGTDRDSDSDYDRDRDRDYSDSDNDIDANAWKQFKLPDMQSLDDTFKHKIASRESLDTTYLPCCLGNPSQLRKINESMVRWRSRYDEAIPMALLVDEADLFGATASNDRTHASDASDTSQTERELAALYSNVGYALLITGTAHTLLFNTTTCMGRAAATSAANADADAETDADADEAHAYACTQVSRVHKMRRHDDYYGLMNERITFCTEMVRSWWNGDGAPIAYSIERDYDENIRQILAHVRDRRGGDYSSFLISEEKVRKKHRQLAGWIMRDFPGMYVIVFHGEFLCLYLPLAEAAALRRQVTADARHSEHQAAADTAAHVGSDHRVSDDDDGGDAIADGRLHVAGGIVGDPAPVTRATATATSVDHRESYGRYDLSAAVKKSGVTIKQVYKVLAMLFREQRGRRAAAGGRVPCVVTISGRFAERGYSFTSDDYGEHAFHLTDQYFPCHSRNKNCTTIAQQLRLQGKYARSAVSGERPVLRLWTSCELEEVVTFYVRLMRRIEGGVMGCVCWDEVRAVIELICDAYAVDADANGTLTLHRFWRYLDVPKKLKNLQLSRPYDRALGGFRLRPLDWGDEAGVEGWAWDPATSEATSVIATLAEWVKDRGLPTLDRDHLLNRVRTVSRDAFVREHGVASRKDLVSATFKTRNEAEAFVQAQWPSKTSIMETVAWDTSTSEDRRLPSMDCLPLLRQANGGPLTPEQVNAYYEALERAVCAALASDDSEAAKATAEATLCAAKARARARAEVKAKEAEAKGKPGPTGRAWTWGGARGLLNELGLSLLAKADDEKGTRLSLSLPFEWRYPREEDLRLLHRMHNDDADAERIDAEKLANKRNHERLGALRARTDYFHVRCDPVQGDGDDHPKFCVYWRRYANKNPRKQRGYTYNNAESKYDEHKEKFDHVDERDRTLPKKQDHVTGVPFREVTVGGPVRYSELRIDLLGRYLPPTAAATGASNAPTPPRFFDRSRNDRIDAEEQFRSANGGYYYWVTPDGWLVLHEPTRESLISLRIRVAADENGEGADSGGGGGGSSSSSSSSLAQRLTNRHVAAFRAECLVELPESDTTRVGIRCVFARYKEWHAAAAAAAARPVVAHRAGGAAAAPPGAPPPPSAPPPRLKQRELREALRVQGLSEAPPARGVRKKGYRLRVVAADADAAADAMPAASAAATPPQAAAGAAAAVAT
jgi:hypothetical protein